MGRQVHLEKGGQDYYVDLLLYHLKLHCYVVIELKIGDFKPEYAGKMNFYLSAVDEDFRSADDKPSIGLILCKSKNKVTVEYALRDVNKPMGVAEYEVLEAMPKELQGELPTIEALEQELEKEIQAHVRPLDQKLRKLRDLLSVVDREEVQRSKDKDAVVDLFDRVLPELAARITKCLDEVIPLFTGFWLAKRVNSLSKPNYTTEELEEAWQRENVNLVGLSLRLEGFKKAGTKAFNVSTDVIFVLENYKYGVGPTREKAWVEKLYHQEWTESELQELAEKCCEEVIEEINGCLERIS
ncbi:hypothetical protein GCM10028895_51070 [Pontibacter rugosus]